MQPIRIIIYEDNEDLRETLIQVFLVNDEVEVVQSFPDCRDIKNQMEFYHPDVVLMDIDMPFVNGIEGARIIGSNFPDIPVIMLTVFEDDDKIFEAIKAGACGYLLKKTPPDRIISSILEVRAGGVPMTPQIARRVLNLLSVKASENALVDYKLSHREREILQCLVKGLSYKLIAAELFISIDTVRTHLKKVYEKLHVHSATEAVSKALQHKII